MARYVYKHNSFMVEGGQLVDKEFEELAKWITSSGIDKEFEVDRHIYKHDSGDYWIHIPELTENQLFAMSLILSMSQLEYQGKQVVFKQPPAPDTFKPENWGLEDPEAVEE